MNIKLATNDQDFYKPSPELLAAINTALLLKRPLLLSGDPGTGKTECANFVARKLHELNPKTFLNSKAIRFDTKSLSQSSDLFYYYDAVANFGDKEGNVKESFISFNSLGQAILSSHGHGSTSEHSKKVEWKTFKNFNQVTPEPTGSVVLIDEIDKAPRDFPNDLLAELEESPFKFKIREMDDLVVVQNPEKPIYIIITSNNEKGLPDAFLRRCIFHHINFPEKESLLKIIRSKLNKDNKNYEFAIDTFLEIRRKVNIAKLPATSELIDWIACLEQHDLLNDKLRNSKAADEEYKRCVIETLGTIAKSRSDFETLKKEFAG